MVNPVLLTKIVLWVITTATATVLLQRRKINKKNRVILLVAGTIIFGFVYGWLTPLNPNPMTLLNNFLLNLKGAPVPVPLQLSIIMLVLMLGFVVASNRSICGWGCQLGLLQDLVYRVPIPKINISKKVTLWTKVLFFAVSTGLLFFSGLNLLGVLNPFSVFQYSLTTISGLTLLAILGASMVFYRPWCRFLCPFGLVGLVAEQFSFYRPRVNRDTCVECMQCVEACPTGAMSDFYEDNRFHNDCFTCGECIQACKVNALNWSKNQTS